MRSNYKDYPLELLMVAGFKGISKDEKGINRYRHGCGVTFGENQIEIYKGRVILNIEESQEILYIDKASDVIDSLYKLTSYTGYDFIGANVSEALIRYERNIKLNSLKI